MEEYMWKNIFENEILDQGINNVWSFCVDENLRPQTGYLQYKQYTYGSFQCSSCKRWWNSAQVHIMFRIRLEPTSRRGTVIMKIYRQRCRRCNTSIFQKPEISRENIKRVISNLVSKIQSMVYGRRNTNPPLMPENYSADVDGPHEKKHCEACQMQVCSWNTEHGEKTMVDNPQLLASSRIQQQTKKIFLYTNAPHRPTAAVHQSPDNESAIIMFVLLIVLIVVWLFTQGLPKQ
ncbi:receptor-transporting protein 3-like [Bufo bufo]|uniref:receptor-transporting protein 3-like n=1 Tax=Bufo bufo TaxID=8384 RepID=UPI001ABED082|nr:receptor-transporting protein 3-like [Bufo bufo]